jgi:hypothetical protein
MEAMVYFLRAVASCGFLRASEVKMRTLVLAAWLSLIAVSAFATPPCSACGLHPAPAPLIGLGIQGALAVGGVLLGSKFLGRWKKQK